MKFRKAISSSMSAVLLFTSVIVSDINPMTVSASNTTDINPAKATAIANLKTAYAGILKSNISTETTISIHAEYTDGGARITWNPVQNAASYSVILTLYTDGEPCAGDALDDVTTTSYFYAPKPDGVANGFSLRVYAYTSDDLSLSSPIATGETNILSISKAINTRKKIFVKKITLKAKKTTVKVGEKIKIKASFSPKNATNKQIKWSVSNTKYAKINSKGFFTAKKKGKGKTVTVKCRATHGSKKTAKIKIKIKK